MRLHVNGAMRPALERTYRDIDLVSSRKAGKDTVRLLSSLGYEPNERFNAMSGGDRLVFYDRAHGRQVDVFVGQFRMCHVVAVGDRLQVDALTVPLAELLLTKLQVVELNEKDLKDIWAIVLEHDVGESDDDAINACVIAKALASDWGLWRTSRGTVESARARLGESGLDDADQALIDARLARLWERVEARAQVAALAQPRPGRRARPLVRGARGDRARPTRLARRRAPFGGAGDRSGTLARAVPGGDAQPRSNILVVFGTRPEAIKMLPVVLALRRSTWFAPVVVATGQHRDLVAPVLEAGGITPDIDLEVGHPGLTLNELVASVMTRLDAFCRERYKATGAAVATRDQVRESGFPAGALVHGDTSSAVAAALAAFNLRIPVGHVEAGLRTGTTLTPFPEELNRQLISRITAFHLAPTTANRQNLVREGIPDERIFVTGNTGIDALLFASRWTRRSRTRRSPPPSRGTAPAWS